MGGRAGARAAEDGCRMALKVRVDSEKCQGHNRCYALAPDVFDVDDLGFAFVTIDGDVPAELEDASRAAVANCPEYAITITE